ncbi:MBL fold metallo-hydrolase [Mucilaginibacter arboris]|uniref:MBL fold metallo-hydrolase n=1 Tax=Mucilaginibacter arboris TaxID=2682090 RepID=A0A7K1SUB0_9SPHI|nr:MBL fold metallo-hydrolase [Mucilaginibacter arboris]MVN20843.1 MBL fold metallo-hydrolase [Mucilaginibacter arboris]
MEVIEVTKYVFQLTLPIVNVFLVDHPAGLILIDTGPKGSKDLIFEGIRQTGKQPEDLKYIILTHAHHDHSGSLAAILGSVNVPVYASALCAEMIKKGIAFEPGSKVLSFLLKLITLFGLIRLQFLYIEPIKSSVRTVQEGDQVPAVNGLQIINAPGHTSEQIALFYPVKEALLFAADSAENLKSLKPAYAYQSAKINLQTLKKLAAFPFDIAVFGHGNRVSKENFKKMSG